MKIKGTDWKRVSSQTYVKGNYTIKRKMLICGTYWVLYCDNLPLHISKEASDCVSALETNKMSTQLFGKPYSEFYDKWQNFFCYHYGFEKTNNVNALRHKEYDIEIFYRHAEYQITVMDKTTGMISDIEYSTTLETFKGIVKRIIQKIKETESEK